MALTRLCLLICVFDFSDMKNAVIGNNKQKSNLIVLGAVPRYSAPHFVLLLLLLLYVLYYILYSLINTMLVEQFSDCSWC